jgi:transposase-like protein
MDVGQERLLEVQRFFCCSCAKSFTTNPGERRHSFSEAFTEDVTRRHVEGESYRVIARAAYRDTLRKISPTSLQEMVASVAARCKTPLEMSAELKPEWEGVLAVDEKKIPVKHCELWCYEAVDSSGDIVHWREVPECSVTEAVKFLEEVKALGYVCRALTSDLDTSLTLAIEKVYPETPHQYCVKHALAVVEKILGYTRSEQRKRQRRGELRTSFQALPSKKGLHLIRASKEFVEKWRQTRPESKKAREIAELRDLAQGILTAKTQSQALDLFAELRSRHSSETLLKWRAIAFLERHWVRLMRHHSVRGLPRTNNMAENFNKQLMRRIKTIESFQHRKSATNYMNLLVAYLRLKPYTDCRGQRKHLNGKSRLQAAGVKIAPQDWLKACLKF